MTRLLRTACFAIVVIVSLGMPVASTAPAPGVKHLAMSNIPTDTARVFQQKQTPEEMLLQSLSSLSMGDTDEALKHVDSLLKEKPTFKLAHLVRGDILSSMGAQMPQVVRKDKAVRDELNKLVAEARQRVVGTSFEPAGRVPAALLQLADHHKHIVFIDTELSRLYLFENRNGDSYLISDYYISIGKNGSRKRRKGDKRTPLGVYFVTQRLPGEDLPDKYGPVAFPVDYPNEWDRRNQRTGSGIWLHGVASQSYSRPPLDSDGCVALINEEIQQLSRSLEPGVTPVIIGESAEWIEYSELNTRRTEAAKAVEQWRADWESGNVDKYLDHYDEQFRGNNMNLAGWSAHKRRVSKSKTNISVELGDVSIFAYPDEEDMIVVTFRQHYESNNFNGSARKRQYWRKDTKNRWRIVNESIATTG